MAGMLILLFPVIKTFFTNPLGDAIHERNSELESTFTEVEQLRTQMVTMRNDYEQRLAATEAEARAQIQAEVKKAQELGASLRAEATQRADEMVARAEQEIASEKARAINDIRVHVVDLSLTAAEKVIGENMNTERNRKLVEEFINTVEVPA
jgi:F-type H+-transporting ATPase subunit b